MGLWEDIARAAASGAGAVGDLASGAYDIATSPEAREAAFKRMTGLSTSDAVDNIGWAARNPVEAALGVGGGLVRDVAELGGDLRGRDAETARRMSEERRGNGRDARPVVPEIPADRPVSERGQRALDRLIQEQQSYDAETARRDRDTAAARSSGNVSRPSVPNQLETTLTNVHGMQDEIVGLGDDGARDAFRALQATGREVNPGAAAAGGLFGAAAEAAATLPLAGPLAAARTGSRILGGGALGTAMTYENTVGNRNYDSADEAIQGFPEDIGSSAALGFGGELLLDAVPSGIAAGARRLRQSAPDAALRSMNASRGLRESTQRRVAGGQLEDVLGEIRDSGLATPETMPVMGNAASGQRAAQAQTELAQRGGGNIRSALETAQQADIPRSQAMAAAAQPPAPPPVTVREPLRSPRPVDPGKNYLPSSGETLVTPPPAGPPPRPAAGMRDVPRGGIEAAGVTPLERNLLMELSVGSNGRANQITSMDDLATFARTHEVPMEQVTEALDGLVSRGMVHRNGDYIIPRQPGVDALEQVAGSSSDIATRHELLGRGFPDELSVRNIENTRRAMDAMYRPGEEVRVFKGADSDFIPDGFESGPLTARHPASVGGGTNITAGYGPRDVEMRMPQEAIRASTAGGGMGAGGGGPGFAWDEMIAAPGEYQGRSIPRTQTHADRMDARMGGGEVVPPEGRQLSRMAAMLSRSVDDGPANVPGVMSAVGPSERSMAQRMTRLGLLEPGRNPANDWPSFGALMDDARARGFKVDSPDFRIGMFEKWAPGENFASLDDMLRAAQDAGIDTQAYAGRLQGIFDNSNAPPVVTDMGRRAYEQAQLGRLRPPPPPPEPPAPPMRDLSGGAQRMGPAWVQDIPQSTTVQPPTPPGPGPEAFAGVPLDSTRARLSDAVARRTGAEGAPIPGLESEATKMQRLLERLQGAYPSGRVPFSDAQQQLQGMDRGINFPRLNNPKAADAMARDLSGARGALRRDIETSIGEVAGPETAQQYAQGSRQVRLASETDPWGAQTGQASNGDMVGPMGYLGAQASAGRAATGIAGAGIQALGRRLARGAPVLQYRLGTRLTGAAPQAMSEYGRAAPLLTGPYQQANEQMRAPDAPPAPPPVPESARFEVGGGEAPAPVEDETAFPEGTTFEVY